jgi:hypothetical protein
VARGHGRSIGAYGEALLDNPLPWTKMRQVYALLGLVKKWGPDRVESACARALEAEALSVSLIGRMIERAMENDTVQEPLPIKATSPARFARDAAHFATNKPGGAK